MEIWLVCVELVAKARDDQPSEIGFMNITTWAETKEAATSKIEAYLDSLGWHLVQIEKADIVDENFQCGDDVADMIERTRNNTGAIILGTLHTYKTN
jgi:hypothetical protein